MAQFPEDVALALAHQDAMLREGRRDEVTTASAKRRDANPKDPIALLLWARLRDGAESRDALQNALRAKPAFPEAVQVLAELEESEDKLDAAKAAVETLLALRGSARDWTYAGFIKERLEDHPGALEAYAKATALEPTLVAPKVNRALLLVADGKPADGLAVLESDAAPPDGSAYWHVGLAIARRAVGQPTRAKESIEAAVKAALGDHRLLLGVTAVAIRGKEPATVDRAISAALKDKPDDPDYLLARAIVSFEMQNPADALETLTAAAKVSPKDAQIKYFVGIAQLRLNKLDKAYAAFKDALATDPTNGRYALALAHTMDRRGAKDVMAAWQHACELNPKDPEPHIDAALWLYNKGKFDDAADQLEKAVRLAPTDPEPLYMLAIIHGDRQGLMGKALDDLREYKKIGGKDEAALAWLDAIEAENAK
jgi:tetratricopeptide (TPR) repeat protein